MELPAGVLGDTARAADNSSHGVKEWENLGESKKCLVFEASGTCEMEQQSDA